MAPFFTQLIGLTKNHTLVGLAVLSVLAVLEATSATAQQQPMPFPTGNVQPTTRPGLVPDGAAPEERPSEDSEEHSTLDIGPDVSAVLRTDVTVSRIIISDPDIVHVVPKTTTEIMLMGNQPGETDVTLWLSSDEGEKNFVRYRVRVASDAVTTSSIKRISLLDAVRARYPESAIEIRSIHDKYVVQGTAKNAAEMKGIIADIRADVLKRTENGATEGMGLVSDVASDGKENPLAKQVISLLDVPPRPQMLLKVRAIEFDLSAVDKILADPHGGLSKVISPTHAASRGARAVLLDTDGMTQALTTLLTSGNAKVLAESDIVAPDGHKIRFLPAGSYRVKNWEIAHHSKPSSRAPSPSDKFVLLTPRVADGQRISLECSPPFAAAGGFPVPPRFTLSGSQATGIKIEFESGHWLAISNLIHPAIPSTLDTQTRQATDSEPEKAVIVFVSAENIDTPLPDDVALYIPAANVQEKLSCSACPGRDRKLDKNYPDEQFCECSGRSSHENLRRLASIQYYLGGDFGFSKASDPTILDYADFSMAHELGLATAELGDVAGAEGHLLAALEWDPSDADLLNDVGYCYYLQDRLEKAELHFRRAIRLSPQSRKAFNNLGLVLAARQKYPESLAMLRSAAPSDADGHANFAYALVQQNKLHNAQLHFSRALRLNGELRKVGEAMLQLSEYLSTAPALAISDDVPQELLKPETRSPATVPTPSREVAERQPPATSPISNVETMAAPPSSEIDAIVALPAAPLSPRTPADLASLSRIPSKKQAPKNRNVFGFMPVAPAGHSTPEPLPTTEPLHSTDSPYLMAPMPRQPDGRPLPSLLPRVTSPTQVPLRQSRSIPLTAVRHPNGAPRPNGAQPQTPPSGKIELAPNLNRTNTVTFVQALKNSIQPIDHGDFMVAPGAWQTPHPLAPNVSPPPTTNTGSSRPQGAIELFNVPAVFEYETDHQAVGSEFNLSD